MKSDRLHIRVTRINGALVTTKLTESREAEKMQAQLGQVNDEGLIALCEIETPREVSLHGYMARCRSELL